MKELPVKIIAVCLLLSAVVLPALAVSPSGDCACASVVQHRGRFVERVEDWSTNNWVFVPTMLYGGNRFRVIGDKYPPIIPRADKDMPITVTDIYRLSADGSPSTVEFLAGDTSAPMFGWWDPLRKKGVLILAEPFTPAGETGFSIAESPKEGVCTFTVTAPGFRGRRYKMCGFVSPSGDKQHGSHDVPFNVVRREFDANSIPEFLDTAFSVRKLLTGQTTPPQIEPFGYLTDLLLATIDRRAWYENGNIGYIINWPLGPDIPTAHLQAGWCGAPPYAIPLLLRPTPERLRRVSRTFDALMSMQGESGFFMALNFRGSIRGDRDKETGSRMRTMVRRQSATVMAGFDAIMRMRQLDMNIKDSWVAAFRKTADALVRLWRREGDLGQFVDVGTGELLVPNSTNGALAPAALLAAADFTGDDSYLRAAEEIAEFYRVRFLERGLSCGGPCDAAQCPDSESAGELFVSFERLWERTGKKEYLQCARTAAALVATWVNAYDYRFPGESMFGKEDVHSTGAVWASVQNRHGAPGHFHYGCGDVLFRLWRATGDDRLWELMADTARGVGQYVHTSNRPFFRPPENESPGSISERVNTGDWEGRNSVGMLFIPNDFNMVWATTALFHMMEVPGVYVFMDKGRVEVRCLDRVEAHVENDELVITNRTAFDTVVSVMVENAEDRRKALGRFPSLNWPRIQLKSGTTARMNILKHMKKSNI